LASITSKLPGGNISRTFTLTTVVSSITKILLLATTDYSTKNFMFRWLVAECF
jgi:hypothetical protein